MASKLGNLLVAVISLGATFVGPFMGMFLAAVLPYNTIRGSIAGVFCSFAVSIWICIGQISYQPREDAVIEGLDKVYGTSYLLLSPIGMVVSFTLVNLFSGADRAVAALTQFNGEFFKPKAEIVLTFGSLSNFTEKSKKSIEGRTV